MDELISHAQQRKDLLKHMIGIAGYAKTGQTGVMAYGNPVTV